MAADSWRLMMGQLPMTGWLFHSLYNPQWRHFWSTAKNVPRPLRMVLLQMAVCKWDIFQKAQVGTSCKQCTWNQCSQVWWRCCGRQIMKEKMVLLVRYVESSVVIPLYGNNKPMHSQNLWGFWHIFHRLRRIMCGVMWFIDHCGVLPFIFLLYS